MRGNPLNRWYPPTLVFFGCLVAGCEGGWEREPEPLAPDLPLGASAVVRTDSSGAVLLTYPGGTLQGASFLQLSEAPVVRIGVTTGPNELQFASISDARRLNNGSFVVVDRNLFVVRLFDAAGRFLRQIGRVGEGPGEYRIPIKVIEGPGEVIGVWDFRQRVLSTFRYDGSLSGTRRLDLRSVIPDPLAPAILPSGAFLAAWEVVGFPPDATPGKYVTSAILALHAEGGSTDTLATINGGHRRITMVTSGLTGEPTGFLGSSPGRWYDRRILASAVPDGIWVTDGTSWTIEHRSAITGSLDRVVHLDLPLERFPDALIGTRPASEYPETLPPIREIFADALGRLWIGVLELPIVDLPAFMGSAVEEWIVLGATGEHIVGRVILPPRSRPMYADGDGVLILVVGALDVPHLEWRTFELFP